PTSSLFPYTTLFRSRVQPAVGLHQRCRPQGDHCRDDPPAGATRNRLAVSSIPRGRLEPTDKEFSPRWGHDSAMEEVAHDPVSRRPVVCVAGVVMGAKVAPRGRGVPTLEAETHLFM